MRDEVPWYATDKSLSFFYPFLLRPRLLSPSSNVSLKFRSKKRRERRDYWNGGVHQTITQTPTSLTEYVRVQNACLITISRVAFVETPITVLAVYSYSPTVHIINI